MSWWKKLFGGTSDKSLDGAMYQVATTLYSLDGKRSAEVRKFENGQPRYEMRGERASVDF